MQIAILHYHLNRGGVARVVENHLLALAEVTPRPEQVVVLHGGRADHWPQERLAGQLPFPLRTQAVLGLDYDSPDGTPDAPPRRNFFPLADRIVHALEQVRFDRARTLLHWHNHALGKNVAVPAVVAELARRGYRMLLQIHDFAEDLRPDNYRHLADSLTPGQIERLPDLLYPQSPSIHYAVLNGRDRQLLDKAGVAKERLHLLPNPVAIPTRFPTVPTSDAGSPPSGTQPSQDERTQVRRWLAPMLEMPVEATWITYPVRGIRRKNVGEMLLWSAAARSPSSRPVWLHVTMTPKNPVERASFHRWQQLAGQLRLPCRFGTPPGSQVSYEQILAACDLLLTTSIAEGFGMVFLECWLARRQLLGRDLPEITSDFRQAGICLEPLAPQLAIPASWIDLGELVRSLEDLYRELRARYGQSPPAAEGSDPFASLVSGATIDFARLPTRMQASVIRRAHHDPEARAQLRGLNRQLDLTEARLAAPLVSRQIEANRQVVGQSYSLGSVGRQLGAIYAWLMATEPSLRIDTLPRGSALLESLLRPDRLYPIRIEP